MCCVPRRFPMEQVLLYQILQEADTLPAYKGLQRTNSLGKLSHQGNRVRLSPMKSWEAQSEPLPTIFKYHCHSISKGSRRLTELFCLIYFKTFKRITIFFLHKLSKISPVQYKTGYQSSILLFDYWLKPGTEYFITVYFLIKYFRLCCVTTKQHKSLTYLVNLFC